MKAIITKVLMILKHLFFRLRVVMTLCIGLGKNENHSDADCNSNSDIEESHRKDYGDEKEQNR